jgi:hypothetical protein
MIELLIKVLDRIVQKYWEVKFYLNYGDLSKIKINKPIFFLGTNGAGLTLISRILRRDPRVVSPTGNYKYWAGRDEMHNVYFNDLPKNLRFGMAKRHASEIKYDELFGIDLGWGYATDRLVCDYRKDENDISFPDDNKFVAVIKRIISTHKVEEDTRFVDKSQSYSLKTPLIKSLIPDAKFIVVSRNPYVMVLRAATNENQTKKLKREITFNERLKFYSETWNNVYKIALDDLGENCLVFKLEDFLLKPELYMKKIINYVELDNVDIDKIMPHSNKEYPIGSTSKDKWYPIKRDINSKYLKHITPEAIEIIDSVLGKTAKRLGYDKP